MSTTQLAAGLFQLQQLDLELDRLKAELQTVTHALQGDARLQKLRAEYKSAQLQLQSGLQTQKEAEWALEDVSRRLQVQEQRLYSGAVSNPKELQSLQQEVQRLRAQQSRQEESALEVVDAAEALRDLAQRKLTDLTRAEEAWQKACSSLSSRHDCLAECQKELRAKRTALSSTFDLDLLTRYDQMRRTKQGRAISKVEQNSCQWCLVILTPSELQRVRISPELQTCTNCGRILYYDRQTSSISPASSAG